MLITGHRGAAGLEPENTLRSFRRACEIGVDLVETDVHLTRDGIVVCIHDRTLDRTTNGSGEVRALTFEEIRQWDAGQGERIPTLEESLAVVRGRARLEIELKGERVTGPVLRLLASLGITRDEVLLISFDPVCLEDVRRQRPDLPVSPLYVQPSAEDLRRAAAMGAPFVSVYHGSVTPDLLESTRALGLGVRAWTVNDPGEMQRLIDLGLVGITTDRPDLLV